jgi:uncharacterized protein YdbL (DUF1318 family)
MRRVAIILATLALALTCCVTVNVYFPAPAVQAAADLIVQEVRPGEEQPAPPEGEAAPQSGLAPEHLWSWLGTRQAEAAEVDINVSTPAIRNLKAAIKSRYGQLEPFYRQGAVGEGMRGYLELREAGGLDLRQRADLNRLIQAENSDRKRLYEEIIKANNFGGEFLGQVEKLFANSWRKEAAAGTMIQDDSGNWRRK